MIDLIGCGFGAIMYWCYALVHNYGIAILLFTVVTKIVLFPLSIWQQKNSIKMVRLQPEINMLKAQYVNDAVRAGEAQYDLYKRENYKPLLGLVPTLIQIPIILGVINVVYKPLTHLIRLSAETIAALEAGTQSYLGVAKLGLAWQIKAIELLKDTGFVQYLIDRGMNASAVAAQVAQFQSSFLGLNMFEVPTLTNGLLAIPIAAVLSTLLLCILQNKVNVLQREQEGVGRWGTTVLMVALALYFSFAVPAAAGLYWAVGNIAAILLMYLVNLLIDSRKYIDYDALSRSKETLRKANTTKKTKRELQREKQRANADYRRFFSKENGNKELVFFSGAGGTYKYYRGIIERLLADTDIAIHYVTSDLNDKVFDMNEPRFIPYYIEGNNLIFFFMKLDCDVMIMTMPEIEKYSYKRSIVRKDIEYVYMFHGVASPNLLLKKGALDFYDTIFCTGANQYEELRREEQVRGITPRNLIKGGYSLIDDTIAAYSGFASIERTRQRPEIIIAPSWHSDNILENCIDELLAVLLGNGYHITLRPHPEFVKRYGHKMKAIMERYMGASPEELTFDLDYFQNNTVFSADILITDWSTVCYEFSFATKRPTLFINTPMKVMNPDYKMLGIVPLDIRVRDEMGRSINMDDLQATNEIIADFLSNKAAYRKRIESVMEYALYNPGSSAAVEAEYIVSSIVLRREAQKG